MNYFQAHKNKRPKKAKYNRESKQFLSKLEFLYGYFKDEMEKLKNINYESI